MFYSAFDNCQKRKLYQKRVTFSLWYETEHCLAVANWFDDLYLKSSQETGRKTVIRGNKTGDQKVLSFDNEAFPIPVQGLPNSLVKAAKWNDLSTEFKIV